MARTRKSILPLNLYKYDVLIEDNRTRSEYFRVTQFDGFFHGGRNGFLLAGASVLQPGSKILVEILNKNGTTVYSAPVPSFVEGNSRLVQVEVYDDTPIGPGKIVLLGCADTYLDGTPIPPEWQNKYNVRWITDVVISPLVENKSKIRFPVKPSIVVSEKFYPTPATASFSESISLPIDIILAPKYYTIFQNGYQLILSSSENFKYKSEYLDGTITGSITFLNGSTPETASIKLPITRIYNNTIAESVGSLIYTDVSKKLISEGYISSSGKYQTEIKPFGDIAITSSVNLLYNKLSAQATGSLYSYANIRIVDTETISGEVHQIRISYKSAIDPGDYTVLANVPVKVQELLAVDSSSKVVELGKFTDLDVTEHWYAATMSLEKNALNISLPPYYNSSSIATNLTVKKSSDQLLDSIYVDVPITGNTYTSASYFIGTTVSSSTLLFPRSEYTLAFDAFISKTSASIQLNQSDYSLEVYLVQQENSETKILTDDLRGQLVGVVNPSSTFQKQNFGRVELNFTPEIIQSGNFGLRFVSYGGFWNIANVSIKPAEEPFFSPDEVSLLVPILDYDDSILIFKAEFLDVNNNSAGIVVESIPTFFTGSHTYVRTSEVGDLSTSGVAAVAFVINGGSNPITTGYKGTIRIPTNVTLSNVGLFTSGSGSIDVDLIRQEYSTYIPSTTAGTSIVGTPLSMSNDVKYLDTTLSGWTTSLFTDDILNIIVKEVAGSDLKIATVVFNLNR